ncbi:MAG: hypothetical protein L6R42_005499, partial [Xanthoria sp. 1 TBL-2021]
MRFAVISSALLACGLGVFAAPSAARLSKPSNPGLESAGAPETPPQLKYAFTAKIDWDLNNLEDGHWAYVRHTGGAILRKTQNGV